MISYLLFLSDSILLMLFFLSELKGIRYHTRPCYSFLCVRFPSGVQFSCFVLLFFFFSLILLLCYLDSLTVGLDSVFWLANCVHGYSLIRFQVYFSHIQTHSMKITLLRYAIVYILLPIFSRFSTVSFLGLH